MSDGSQSGDVADAFANRVQAEYGESIRHLVVFGSAVRDRGPGVHADAEALVVLDDHEEADDRRLERLAESVGLEYGVVLSVHVLPADRFDGNEDHPFVRTAFDEGRSYV